MIEGKETGQKGKGKIREKVSEERRTEEEGGAKRTEQKLRAERRWQGRQALTCGDGVESAFLKGCTGVQASYVVLSSQQCPE